MAHRNDRTVRAGDAEFRTGDFVRVAGVPLRSEEESGPDPQKNDHLWLTVRAGEIGEIRIALTTWSVPSLAAGVDPRVQLAVVSTRWTALPPAGISPGGRVDYEAICRDTGFSFRPHDAASIVREIVGRFSRAIFAEAWGELYVREHVGIHQVHSRRSSLALPTNVLGRDGALRLYFDGGDAELVMLKFNGQ